mmetsp:Transcript_4099/g.10265  ORF Transcript_4099/g.10265 Transcript_4099/m.10265 type:complete len:258 (+) Transcript_4099:104-877(+)
MMGKKYLMAAGCARWSHASTKSVNATRSISSRGPRLAPIPPPLAAARALRCRMTCSSKMRCMKSGDMVPLEICENSERDSSPFMSSSSARNVLCTRLVDCRLNQLDMRLPWCMLSMRSGFLSSCSSCMSGEVSRSRMRTALLWPWKNRNLRAAMRAYCWWNPASMPSSGGMSCTSARRYSSSAHTGSTPLSPSSNAASCSRRPCMVERVPRYAANAEAEMHPSPSCAKRANTEALKYASTAGPSASRARVATCEKPS